MKTDDNILLIKKQVKVKMLKLIKYFEKKAQLVT